MSNPNSLLAPPVFPSSSAVEESSNHAFCQDAHEHQDVPDVASSDVMPSNTEALSPPTPTQNQDDGSELQISTEGTTPRPPEAAKVPR